MDRDPPARIAGAAEVVDEEIRRLTGFVAREIQPHDPPAMPEQRFELPARDLGPVGAAQDSDRAGRETEVPRARRHAVEDCFHHALRVEAMGLGHEPRAEAELDVIDPFLPGVRHALVRYAAACLQVDQHGGHPPEARDEGHHPGLGLGHLDVGPQALHVPRRQLNAVAATQV